MTRYKDYYNPEFPEGFLGLCGEDADWVAKASSAVRAFGRPALLLFDSADIHNYAIIRL